MQLADVDVLILPGSGGAGPDHWLTHWEAAFPAFQRVQQNDWAKPVYADWVARLNEALQACRKPVVLVGHSLGTCLTVRWAAEFPHMTRHVAAVFLVATTDIARFEGTDGSPAIGFAPTPLQPLPFPSTVIASQDDERVSFARSTEFAQAWGAQLIDIGYCGHIGSAARLGLWPEGLVHFGQLLAKARLPG